MDTPPVLIVSHTFPPFKGIGGRRWAKFAKVLAQRGHAVHVIHSAGRKSLLGSLWNEDVVHPNIHVHPLAQRYPTVLFTRPLTTLRQKLGYHVWRAVLRACTRGNWLDKAIRWRRPFLRKAEELITEHGIRHVIITGAPFRLFHYGVLLRRRHGIHLVCDLRDPWTWHDGYGQGSLGAADQAYERALEQEMMREADRITSPHASVIDHLRTHYAAQAAKCLVLGHAIDPDELGTPQPPRNDGRFRMIYAGSWYGAQEADAYFQQLLRAFERFRDHWPQLADKASLDLYITGSGTGRYKELLQQRGLEGAITIHAPLPARQVFARIAQADAVLIFIPSFNKDLLGTKFTEIFYLRRPVIHVGEPGAVSAAILSQKLGVSIAVDRLVDELPAIMAGDRELVIDPSVDLSPHLLGTITTQLQRDVLGLG